MSSWLGRRWKWFIRAPLLRVVWGLVMLVVLVVNAVSFVWRTMRRTRVPNKFAVDVIENKARQGQEEFEDKFHREVIELVLPSLLQSEMKHFVPAVNFSEFLLRKLRVERTLRENSPLNACSQKVFIVGLPRTGSTFLHQLCALDPNCRTVRAWEFRNPPKFNESIQERQAKINKVQALLSGFYKIAPAIKDIHYIEALDADECVQGFMDCAVPDWYLWGAVAADEAFAWYVDHDMSRGYANYAKFLKTLPVQANEQCMWLKSPHHTFKLPEIAKTFPGSKFVWLHRERVENSVASCCSMNQAILDATCPWYVNERELGERTLKRMSKCVKKAMQDRELLESQGVVFVDIKYAEFKRDPVRELRGLYGKLGMEFGAEFESRLGDLLLAEKRTSTPKHQYDLKDFDLSQQQVADEFAEYNARFF
ncbi:hypothetical protein BASA81_002709 [Batrachochytrium salamandrivorans]|nr:hypothetical protein BASA81_002709 [Batrachochytrium salamandrivorans]